MPFNFEQEIKSILNNDKFDEEDFRILKSGLQEITIQYIYSKNNYNFKFTIPNEKKEVVDNSMIQFSPLGRNTKWVYMFKGSMSPGKYYENEKFSYHNFSMVKKEISLWVNYLYEELKTSIDNLNNDNKISHKNNKDFEIYTSHFEEIEKQIDEKIDDNETFTKEDKEYLNNKLDEMKNKFEEQLKNIILDQKNLKTELDKMNEDFSKLKNSANIMSKKNWCKKFLCKIKDLIKDPNKRKIVFTTLKGVNIFLKKYDISIPMLEEGIETVEQISK